MRYGKMNILLNILYFPLDLARLTVHVWQFLLEGYFNRFFRDSKEQICVICRDLDTGWVPRPIRAKANYRNIWLLKTFLLREVEVWKDSRTGKKIPICRNEGANVIIPGWTPFLALGLLLFWTSLLVCVLSWTGWIPEEVDPVRAVVAFFKSSGEVPE